MLRILPYQLSRADSTMVEVARSRRGFDDKRLPSANVNRVDVVAPGLPLRRIQPVGSQYSAPRGRRAHCSARGALFAAAVTAVRPLAQ